MVAAEVKGRMAGQRKPLIESEDQYRLIERRVGVVFLVILVLLALGGNVANLHGADIPGQILAGFLYVSMLAAIILDTLALAHFFPMKRRENLPGRVILIALLSVLGVFYLWNWVI